MGTTRRKYAPRLPPEQRREQLLDGALALIAGGGFDALTMEAVARRAGVTKPVVYELYANRAEVIAALLQREAERATAQVLGSIPPAGSADRPPADAYADGVRAFLTSVVEHPDRWRLVLLPPEGTPPEFRVHVELVRARVLAQVSTLADVGLRARGEADPDAELLGHAMLALAEMAGRLAITDPARFPTDRLVSFVAKIAHVLPNG
ncbi:TetR/AcrR family transcriptional regulator [Saccharothrix syringae]|uniref:TetR/AcrR family transcriptional regulator n=1 Tax=Saccharothrix syringae TaxID=103733 RepID=A0A5Q0HAW9_SACSY|nr:TetR/AcrR family transcriptional regulator [Saccharothrix syringae]QFZ23085.1 TetR/AcrR family transcriptional regulator [Saccharothrix syringae]